MELIECYLNKVKKIKGMYVLQVGDISDDDFYELLYHWNELEKSGYVDEPLIVLPNEVVLAYEDRFTFERAMQIVRAGGKVRRLIWAPHEYIAIDMAEDVSFFTRDHYDDYCISQDDLEAVDWILYEEQD